MSLPKLSLSKRIITRNIILLREENEEGGPMETLVRQLIADSMELEIPPLTPRRGALSELANAATEESHAP